MNKKEKCLIVFDTLNKQNVLIVHFNYILNNVNCSLYYYNDKAIISSGYTSMSAFVSGITFLSFKYCMDIYFDENDTFESIIRKLFPSKRYKINYEKEI